MHIASSTSSSSWSRRLRALVVLGGCVAGPAGAHVLLDEPQRRYDDMKGPPCGRGDGTDGRTDHFTRYQPGEKITVRFTETINHTGSFRIAFDDDGADAADFDAHVLWQDEDPDNDSGRQWQADITLPDVQCDNCTLQLEQVMTTSPTPSVGEIYHQCADLVLGDGDSAAAEVGGCNGSGGKGDLAALAALLLLRRGRRGRRGRR